MSVVELDDGYDDVDGNSIHYGQRDNSPLTQMVEVELKNEDSFLIAKETLSRIGLANKSNDKLTQTCHIFHKRGRYYLTHFKTLFEMDGKSSTFNNDDRARLAAIAQMMNRWGIVRVLDQNLFLKKYSPESTKLKVVAHRDKHNWEFVEKYQIGNKK